MTELERRNLLRLAIRMDDLEDARRRIEALFVQPMKGWSDEVRRSYTLDLGDGGTIDLERNWDATQDFYREYAFRDHGVVAFVSKVADPAAIERVLTEDPVLQATVIWRRIDGVRTPPKVPPPDLDVDNWSFFGLLEPVERMAEIADELNRRLEVPMERIESPYHGVYFRTLDHPFRHCNLWADVGPMWHWLSKGEYEEFPLRFSAQDYRDLKRLDRVLLEDGLVDAELLVRRIGPPDDDDDVEDDDELLDDPGSSQT